MVHVLCRKHQNHLAVASRAGALGELNGLLHVVHADFFAGLALFVIQVRLAFFVQWPAQLQHGQLRHQNTQVCMGAHLNGVATRAGAACQALMGGLAEPSGRQCQRKVVLPKTCRAMKQPRMARAGR